MTWTEYALFLAIAVGLVAAGWNARGAWPTRDDDEDDWWDAIR